MQKLITLSLLPEWIKLLDELVERKFYADRSRAIRAAVRDLLELHREAGHFKAVEVRRT